MTKSSFLSYFFPQTVLTASSRYNRLIRVNKERGKFKLLVNGSRQSGECTEMLWKEAFKAFGIPENIQVRSILVLGVGGGDVIHMLHSYYPQAIITGVDIDETMIDIGKQYFGLDQIENLTLVCQDAEVYMTKSSQSKHRFDLIIVDVFIGTHVPELVRNDSFLRNLKASLTQTGAVVINYLREFEYLAKSEQLKKTLSDIFPHIAEKSIHNNRFFLTSSLTRSSLPRWNFGYFG